MGIIMDFIGNTAKEGRNENNETGTGEESHHTAQTYGSNYRCRVPGENSALSEGHRLIVVEPIRLNDVLTKYQPVRIPQPIFPPVNETRE